MLSSPLVPQGLRVPPLARRGHGLGGRRVHLGPGWRQGGAVVAGWAVYAGGRGQGVRYQGGQVGVTPSPTCSVTVAAVAGAGHLVLSSSSVMSIHWLALVLHGHTSPAASVVGLPHSSLH